jgi:hypothetical protein
MKPVVLFFSRDYQSQFFPSLTSDKYDSIHVTLNVQEKKNVEERGGKVVACMEEVYDDLEEANIDFPYLDHSIGSDRFLTGHSLTTRLQILKKCVSLWSQIFDQYKPIFVVNEVVAIEISEIMYIEARKRGIKYLGFGAFAVKSSFYWHENPFHSSMPEKLKQVSPSQNDIKDAKDYIIKITNGPIDNPYIKEFSLGKDVKRLKLLLKQLAGTLLVGFKVKDKIIRQLCYAYSPSYFLNEINYYFRYLWKQNSYDKIEDLSSDDNCAFYPMHFEPEATLFYMSTYYDNQLALVENLLKCLPENQYLLVKEHPAQAGFLTQKPWLNLKKRFPNIKFIKAEVTSKEIILRSNVTITLVSTAGFESIILDRPVIVLGKVYFDAFKGVNYCENFEQIYRLLRNQDLLRRGENIEEYLAKLIAMQNSGNPWPHPELYSKENIRSVRESIEKMLP